MSLHRLTHDEVIERLSKGEFLFSYDARDKSVSVEKDINSLVTFTAEKTKVREKQNRPCA